jgi:tetratricopeptide (TPR) repeat protein
MGLMKCAAALLAAGLGVSCVSRPAVHPATQPTRLQISLEARLADADALAARGCYVCLQEAADAYVKLLQMSDSPALIRKALENDLMIAVREVELRLPDSGARQRAHVLRERGTADYDAYFEALDALDAPLVAGGRTWDDIERQRAGRRDLAARLEAGWPAGSMAAYFYLSAAISAADFAQLKRQLPAIVDAHLEDLSVKYRVQAFAPTFSEAQSNELLAAEPRFGEVHLLLAQDAIFHAALVPAHHELTLAHQTLPTSALIARVFGNLEMVFARYSQALTLYDQVLASVPDQAAKLGRAIALSYLKRHRDAIAVLEELLVDIQSSPGDKHYWLAWNHLQLGESQAAYDEAKAALQAMANSDVYRLAGIASYNLAKVLEARGYFEASLEMNGGDCDSLRYLGLIDSAERRWPPALTRFSAASACYQQLFDKLSADLVEKQADTSGLVAGQIAGLESDIEEAKSQQAVSAKNTAIASRNAGVLMAPPR